MSASPSPVDQLVVIGSSAGGVEALGTVLAGLPRDLPAAIVIAQHLDTSRPSRLGDVLAPRSVLPVVTVHDNETLKPGTVYVVPANRHVEISDHHLSLHRNATRRPTPSVDLLFESAAAIFGERLIAVILSGSGSDGAVGAHAVKEAGGAVIIQDPSTAAFPSMPRSLEAPLVDAVVPLDHLAAAIARFVFDDHDAEPPASEPGVEALLDRIRDRRGIDFSAYKTPTIQRRLRRRMAASNVSSIAEYINYTETHPEEEQRLVADFLIKVTRFFRDGPLFDRLRQSILPELIAAASEDERELRLWSAGCATGEEAYSLAILVATLLERHPSPPNVRIFATDLDEGALAFARRGAYPASVLADSPPEVVQRWFNERDGVFEVSKQIRAMIVFGGHDLGQRPPFPHTDLILCRNVLIYFTPELQRRALEIFAYSLRDSGYLVLGKSETPRPVERSFEAVDRRLRIYRRHGPRELLLPARLQSTSEVIAARGAFSGRMASTSHSPFPQFAETSPEVRGIGLRAEDIVRKLPIGIAMVTSSYDIEMINGAAREMLGIHGAAIGQDLVHLAKRVESNPLRALFDEIGRSNVPIAKTTVAASSSSGITRTLELTCLPDRPDQRGTPDALLLVIDDVTERADQLAEREMTIRDMRVEGEQARATAARMTQANQELLAANPELTDAVDRLREQGEDLRIATTASQVAAEEIETLNEELQSSNEELETLHEEAQATVEELNVANEELQARTVELETLANTHAQEQARLSTILAGMADAVLVVDRDGRPIRSNNAFEEIMGGLVSPFSPANEHGVPLSAVEAPTHRVAQGESFRVEFTALARDGTRRWFEATGRPLHGDDGGGVLVIRDITDRSVRMLQEEFLSWAGHELRTPLTALQSYLQMAARRLGRNDDERVRAYLASASEQAQRQAALVEELVDGTRLRSGRYSFTTSPVDLVQVVEHSVEISRTIAPKQVIEFTTDEPMLFINGNAGRLEQAFLNLLNNAIGHAVGTDRIDVSVARTGGSVEVRVRDYGPGIPLDVQETIFERFYQAGQTSSGKESGLGLGLFIVREIARAHGGEVSVESKPGEGAEFTIRLPLLDPQPVTIDKTVSS